MRGALCSSPAHRWPVQGFQVLSILQLRIRKLCFVGARTSVPELDSFVPGRPVATCPSAFRSNSFLDCSSRSLEWFKILSTCSRSGVLLKFFMSNHCIVWTRALLFHGCSYCRSYVLSVFLYKKEYQNIKRKKF